MNLFPGSDKHRELAIKFEIVKFSLGAFLCLLVGGLFYLWIMPLFQPKEPEPPQINTTSVMIELQNLSHLGTLQTSYFGIAEGTSAEDFNIIEYYVSYEAIITAGIDLNQVILALDHEAKTFTATLPKAKILDREILIESLDFLFMNSKANTESVSGGAYQFCLHDLVLDTSSMNEFESIAYDNAQSAVKAFLLPFMEPLGPEYQLILQQEETL